jgi:hypothetical protein
MRLRLFIYLFITVVIFFECVEWNTCVLDATYTLCVHIQRYRLLSILLRCGRFPADRRGIRLYLEPGMNNDDVFAFN